MRYLYMILNIESNKAYIGQTNNLRTRKSGHFSSLRRDTHNNSLLQRAFNKYGEEAFEFLILDNLSDEDCDIHEIKLIKWFKDLDLSYNLDLGGCLTKQMAEETKIKIGEANRGKKISEEQKEILRKINIGKKLSEKTIENLRRINKGNNYVLGNKFRLGKKHSEETKQLIASKTKGKKASEETKEKLRVIKRSSGILPPDVVLLKFKVKDPKGFIHEGTNLREFCRNNDLEHRNLWSVIKGKRNHHKGWTSVK